MIAIRIACAAALLLSAFGRASAAPDAPVGLTLQQAQDIALRNRPALQAQQHTAQSAEQVTRQIEANRFPQVTGVATVATAEAHTATHWRGRGVAANSYDGTGYIAMVAEVSVDRTSRAFRVDPGAEKHLVRIDIPDSGQDLLVHQRRLDRSAAPGNGPSSSPRVADLPGNAMAPSRCVVSSAERAGTAHARPPWGC